MRDREPDAEHGRTLDEDLAAHVKAASSLPPRLNPYAVERIEQRLLALGPDGGAGAWRALRLPAYALAVGLVAVVAWEKMAPPRPVLVTREASLTERGPPPLRLESGSIELRTDGESAVVVTPSARVEIAPASAVRITVLAVVSGERDVRIAATAGSAKVTYFDGWTELALPEDPVQSAVRKGQVKRRVHIAPPPPVDKVDKVVEAAAPIDPEQASLQHALSRMSQASEEAITLLDDHLARYANGITRPRAQRSRIALLLRLQRRSDALLALDAMTPISPELLVLRAELRCDSKRFEEAIGDYGAVLVSGDEQFAGRALFGRAMCEQAMGDLARMSEDLEHYLIANPRGELAEKARAELRSQHSRR